MGEVLDAMALVAGMMMATHPDAKTPSRLREMCSEHAKNLAERTRQGIANPEAARIFDAVLTDGDRFN
ncbi:hypothetical protein [Phenylobacterium sp.]|uniref:hypothetical protein n=1 Tax=Phenylobacterium sp. TaxID=1871053 RepID=UPI00286D6A94|nr:hypothetical protein [Phenylobacterium sp.]